MQLLVLYTTGGFKDVKQQQPMLQSIAGLPVAIYSICTPDDG